MRRSIGGRWITVGVVGIIVLCVVLGLFSSFTYIKVVDEAAQEIAVTFASGQIQEVVGPGIHFDFGYGVDIQTISTAALPFSTEDRQILTKDSQIIGLQVTGDIFRPGFAERQTVLDLWSQYGPLFVNDDAAKARLNDFALQAMKSCVGDKNFSEAVVGESRDALGSCINERIQAAVEPLGLKVRNVVVPQVFLDDEKVIARLQEIVDSRQLTEKAQQDALKAEAEAARDEAIKRGTVREQQSEAQETAIQAAALASLEAEQVLAEQALIEAQAESDLTAARVQRSVIEANRANEKLDAELGLEIALLNVQIATADAEAKQAATDALAKIYAENPEYVDTVIAGQKAAAMSNIEKIVYVPEGTVPNFVVTAPGVVPTIDAADTAPGQ